MKLLLGPGFISGLVVGLVRVESWKDALLGYVAALCVAALTLPLLIVPQAIWFFIPFFSLFVAVTTPYCCVGALMGFFIRKYVRS